MDVFTNQSPGDTTDSRVFKRTVTKLNYFTTVNRKAAIVGGFLDLATLTADVEHCD